jgi:hypothetical protein
MQKEQIIKRILDKSKKEQLEIFFELYFLLWLKKYDKNKDKFNTFDKRIIESLNYYYNIVFKSDDK